MKPALIAVGLFLLSYIAVNGGLGERPFLLIVPVLVVIGAAMGARALMGGGRRAGARARTQLEEAFLNDLPPPRHVPGAPKPSGSPGRAPGSKARKLF
jgi:hypothetical protein